MHGETMKKVFVNLRVIPDVIDNVCKNRASTSNHSKPWQ